MAGMIPTYRKELAMNNQANFNVGQAFTERGGMWDGMRWRVVRRWETNGKVFVRFETTFTSTFARRTATPFTARVAVTDGVENCAGQFCGRVFAKGGRA